MIFVRTTIGQPFRIARFALAAIARPLSPASLLAYGSWKRASGRSDSIAR